jgi:hypothetical protein
VTPELEADATSAVLGVAPREDTDPVPAGSCFETIEVDVDLSRANFRAAPDMEIDRMMKSDNKFKSFFIFQSPQYID